MTTSDQRRPAAVGFHSGELAVQQHAGVQAQAARLARMVGPGELRAGIAAFFADATFAAVTARDPTGRLWTAPLMGPPGFVYAGGPSTLRVGTSLPSADPLHSLPTGQPAGIIVVDFATRRRVRINGVLTQSGEAGLTLDAEQAYGNCPQYIQQRHIDVDEKPRHPARKVAYNGELLRENDIRLIQSADTFFLGTTHPESGNDASHRGGPAGFVRVTPEGLWWPDYPGNNMFNSSGNLAVDPTAALLFVDFRTGNTLQLSGTAALAWDAHVEGDDGETGRSVQFIPQHVVATQ
ncbi:pyridoxamine 5'-phosphate oxidase family protein [Mycolicibacter sp. MYC123]|uniref:Pyridoxamine 5'-phosphate oxidase family protein n=1 Tax=[Mycobacterium] zoologicum TaxID=2872311 RepID=A0ABU5YLM1_9MYCO|nr:MULTISPECIES: pyridoxamine 5'-phosphate oxidase family protein [unclassified Mycolicibacter]MEB3049874.1 pyridoxamine 5'-phosphate oxidase family protein [Mycolicibacter sp. MYC123]MEB3062253.1 pyridoxamine 5'-phosphate oxidase family protein [Mycolicibacter sp. MYC101]